MLKKLIVKNFRSIRDAEVRFSESGLTVVIGANGSGKSNLIKCLDFVASVARDGVESAVYAQKSLDALIPKSLPAAQRRGARISISYEFEMWRPHWYLAELPSPGIYHTLVLAHSRGRIARLESELFRFTYPLLVQHYEKIAKPSSAQETPPDVFFNSWVEFDRASPLEPEIRTEPNFFAYRSGFLQWLGLSFLEEAFANDSPEIVHRTLRNFIKQMPGVGDGGSTSVESWLKLGSVNPLIFCTEANTFRQEISAIKRYDFQLLELRREQDSRAGVDLSVEGRGLPSLIRRMRASSDEQVHWERVAGTLRSIAPHIVDASVSKLKSGKEFIEFLETKSGRPVESWESSDGTLRALAILIAIETHPQNGAILIEEPEQGLHPWAIRTLVSHIRDVIEERKIQVIMTTHSQQLLDGVEPGEVVVATRDEETGTSFRGLTEVLPNGDIEMGEVGRLWVQGLLGAVPVYE